MPLVRRGRSTHWNVAAGALIRAVVFGCGSVTAGRWGMNTQIHANRTVAPEYARSCASRACPARISSGRSTPARPRPPSSPEGSLDNIIAQLKYPLPCRRRSRPDVLGRSGSRASRIAGVAEPELPDRLGGIDLPGRTAEEEAQQQPEMPAGPGVTGPA